MNMQSGQLSETVSSKTKENGVVYTPQEVATEVCKLVASKMVVGPSRILEPSCGDGAFVSSVVHLFPHSTLDAVDVDERAISKCRLQSSGVNFQCANFFDYAKKPDLTLYDLIIGNPPYVRKSNFSASLKQNLIDLASDLDCPQSLLVNSWPAFVLASSALLSSSGCLAFVVPYELITVHYGLRLLEELLTVFKRVDVYIPDEKAFSQIDQDAVTLLAFKETDARHGLFLNKVQSLSRLQPQKTSAVPISSDGMSATDMKSFLLESDQLELMHKLRARTQKISDFCTSAAGTVTAANKFFILNADEVEELGLSDFAKPIIQKASHVEHKLTFDGDDFESLKASGKPCFLIDFGSTSLKELPHNALTYIDRGEELGIHERYKCRNRDPWYRIPKVPSTDGFFFKRSHMMPRICSNRAGVLTTDTAYQISMKEGVSVDDLCYSFYSSLTLLFTEVDGRFYGGGVLELTPREFRGLPFLLQSPTCDDRKSFEDKFIELNAESQSRMIERIDARAMKMLGLEEQQWKALVNARKRITSHRLRHGTS